MKNKKHGGCSLIGRAAGCGPVGCGFKSHRPPQLRSENALTNSKNREGGADCGVAARGYVGVIVDNLSCDGVFDCVFSVGRGFDWRSRRGDE